MLYRKVFVEVTLRARIDGSACPLSFVWENGVTYRIDRVTAATRAAATHVGGHGIRYTVLISGHERYLFNDMGRWFMEVAEK